MKIEMGESLFYSWLRHVKDCQVVQTNWKVSPTWDLLHAEELESMLSELKDLLRAKGLTIFAHSALSQIIRQGECDVLGVSSENGSALYYAVDVAFHEAGLNYKDTVCKVIQKCIRTALCLYGFLGTKNAEIVFASPVIKKGPLKKILPLIEDINGYFRDMGFDFCFRVICNDGFYSDVLSPILAVSSDVADTSELFMRAYQLCALMKKQPAGKPAGKRSRSQFVVADYTPAENDYKELKVGQIARNQLRNILKCGKFSAGEIADMVSAEYAKEHFGIHHPLLSKQGGKHYYAEPVPINGEPYYLCCEWYEKNKEALIAWIRAAEKQPVRITDLFAYQNVIY